MRATIANSQLTNYKTYMMVLDDMIELAENVYTFKNIPDYIDEGYVNQVLLLQGSIAWFYDDVVKSLVALPYSVMNGYDIYNRPKEIMARARNGRYYRKLKQGEFVIMYDNNRRMSMLWKIKQRAERISMCIRTEDINIFHQRTPRMWKTSKDKESTVKGMITNIDSMQENVVAYDSVDIEDLQGVLAPAPYVTDKLDEHLEKEWQSFYRLIGITSVAIEKRERLITDEVNQSQGGTVASRFNRYTPRLKAVEQINKKFGAYLDKKIEVEYYDGVPSEEKNGGVDDVHISENISTNE